MSFGEVLDHIQFAIKSLMRFFSLQEFFITDENESQKIMSHALTKLLE
jgi:hypothetical protein